MLCYVAFVIMFGHGEPIKDTAVFNSPFKATEFEAILVGRKTFTKPMEYNRKHSLGGLETVMVYIPKIEKIVYTTTNIYCK